ncbi:hypothetical protein MAL08_04585 [Leptospira noguchii]|uniref:hypothetical protein n=1 Tax=Leptospira noguchii TaxID=28182 RepID=UPI001FB794A2|nr:hypothetical protein [Leptospira noguchii]UOG38601.1 hypothetical protein MAL08_04585 [Leptospira noguchii]
MLRSIVSSIEFEKFRRNWSEKNNSASHSPWVVRSKLSVSLPMGRSTGREPVHYEICELRRRPIGSRCIEFIIRPNFLTSNSR